MFGDLDWPLNASRGLSAIAEFVVSAHCVSIAAAEGSPLNFIEMDEQKLQW